MFSQCLTHGRHPIKLPTQGVATELQRAREVGSEVGGGGKGRGCKARMMGQVRPLQPAERTVKRVRAEDAIMKDKVESAGMGSLTKSSQVARALLAPERSPWNQLRERSK